MSQEHVEVVQRFFDDYNETGHPCWADIDPEVVWVVDLDAFIGGTYHGHEGGRTILGRMAEVFGEVRAEIDELLDVGDSVVALVRIRVQGLQSGAPGMQQGAVVFKLCDGLIVEYRSTSARRKPSRPWGCRHRVRRSLPASTRHDTTRAGRLPLCATCKCAPWSAK